MTHLYIDTAANLLDAIHRLEAATCKAEQATQVAGAMDVEVLVTEAKRLRRELAHYRRLYAAEVVEHLRC